MKKLLGAMFPMDTDWTGKVYYGTSDGVIYKQWGETGSIDPDKLYKETQAKWDKNEADLERLAETKHRAASRSRMDDITRYQNELENLMLNLSEHMEVISEDL